MIKGLARGEWFYFVWNLWNRRDFDLSRGKIGKELKRKASGQLGTILFGAKKENGLLEYKSHWVENVHRLTIYKRAVPQQLD